MAKISTYTTVQSTTTDLILGSDTGSSDATQNFELGVLTVVGTAPAATGSTGTVGQIAADANYLYVCVAANTWKRVAIAAW